MRSVGSLSALTPRGSTREWRRLRDEVLRVEPACRVCGLPATEVDHIVRRAAGGTDDIRNLMPVCADCHLKRHGGTPRANRPHAPSPARTTRSTQPRVTFIA